MIKRVILPICIMILFLSAGTAYCVMAVSSSSGSIAADDKAPGNVVVDDKTTSGKGKEQAAGKVKPAPKSRPADSKTSGTEIHASTGETKESIPSNVTRKHFLLEKVVGNTFYTKDGDKVQIPTSAKIINNTHNGEVVNAELTYVNGVLIEAMIR